MASVHIQFGLHSCAYGVIPSHTGDADLTTALAMPEIIGARSARW
jgi:hypothetical protein